MGDHMASDEDKDNTSKITMRARSREERAATKDMITIISKGFHREQHEETMDLNITKIYQFNRI
jgi:hypothetical protein